MPGADIHTHRFRPVGALLLLVWMQSWSAPALGSDQAALVEAGERDAAEWLEGPCWSSAARCPCRSPRRRSRRKRRAC